MALRTSRRSVLRGAPAAIGGGNSGAMRTHWSSVRSLGYGLRGVMSMIGSWIGTAIFSRSSPESPIQIQPLQISAPVLRLSGPVPGWNRMPGLGLMNPSMRATVVNREPRLGQPSRTPLNGS